MSNKIEVRMKQPNQSFYTEILTPAEQQPRAFSVTAAAEIGNSGSSSGLFLW